jgi:hypothetical protein
MTILGMSIAAFTQLHVVLSLIGIASGLVTMAGLAARNALHRWTALFLASTGATVITGFLFPFVRFRPAHVFGALTTVALTLAILGRYRHHMEGGWRRTFIFSSAFGLYLNSFIAVVQAFQKIPALHAMAPTRSDAPFVAAQVSVLILCAGLGVAASRAFVAGSLARGNARGL